MPATTSPARGALGVDVVDVVGDARIVPVLLLANPHVVVVLTVAAREDVPLFRLPLTVKLAGPGRSGSEPRELGDVERGHFEEPRPRPIAGRDQQRPEVLLQRHELADQRRGLDVQARPVDVRERDDLEQPHCPAREQRDATRRRQAPRLVEVVPHPFEIGRDLVAACALQRLALEGGERRANAVLHLDEVLATRLVARLQLQITRHDPVGAGLDRAEPPDGVPHGIDGCGEGQCSHG
jgi:hypothetical protein